MRDRRVQIVLAVIVVAGWWLGGEQASIAEPFSDEHRPVAEPSHRVHRETRWETHEPIAVPSTDLIDVVTVDPAVACVGEDIVVTTELLPGARGARVVTAGQPGQVVVTRFEEPGVHEIRAVANAWESAIDREVSAVEVEECPGAPAIEVRVRRLEQDVVELTAVHPEQLGPAVDYNWDFGDGGTYAGTDPSVQHDYTFRQQSEPDTTFLVKLVARDGTGREARRVVHVHFVNALHLTARTGSPIIPARAPLFPQEIDGELVLPLRLGSIDGLEDTVFDEVRIRALPCDDGEARQLTLAADEVLGTTALGSGPTDNELRFSGDALPPGTCDVEARLVGRVGERVVQAIVAMRVGSRANGLRLRGQEAQRAWAGLDELGARRATQDDIARALGGSEPSE